MASVISVMAKLQADASNFVAGMKKAETATTNLKNTANNVSKDVGKNFDTMGAKAGGLGGIVKKAGAALVAFGAINFVSSAVTQASAFEAEFEGVNQIFGDSAKAVQDFADQAAFSAGMSEVSALRSAKSLGAYGKAAGLSAGANAEFSTSLLQAAGDLGSFYDVSTDDALRAIQMGLRGEAEGLRRFGILLDQNTLQQQAFKDGLITTTNQALTPQQKVLATHSAIMEKMGVAQGDFVKYNDTYGNSIKTVGALMQNLKADVGSALLPALAQLATALVPVIQSLGPVIQKVLTALSPLISAVTNNLASIIPIMTPILDVVGSLAGVFAELINTALPPILLVLPPILELFKQLAVPLLGLVQTLLPPLAQILTLVANSFLSLMPAVQAIMPSFISFIDMVGVMLGDVLVSIMPLLSEFMGVLMTLLQALMPLIPPLLNIVKTLLPPFVKLVKALLPIIVKMATLITTLLVGGLTALIQILTPVLQALADFIGGAMGMMADAIEFLYPLIEPVLNAIIDGINMVLGWMGIKGLPKLPKKMVTDAKKQGEAIGKAKLAGEAKIIAQGTGITGGAVAGKEAKVVKAVKKKRDLLAEKLATSRDFAKKVKENLLGGVNVTDLGGSANSIIDNLKNRITAMQQFGQKINDLKAMGLNKTAIEQIVSSGVEQGGATASAILAGGKDSVRSINSLTTQANRTATGVGLVAQDAVFNRGAPSAVANYDITINAGMGTDGTAVGKQIVAYIRNYEKANGKLWKPAT